MGNEKGASVTKILFVDNDEAGFQVRQCIARVLEKLPAMELFHANDATEALTLLDQLKPDVIVLDHEHEEEKCLFLESLSSNHPPVIVQSAEDSRPTTDRAGLVRHVPRNDSLEGLHQTLILATSLGTPGQGSVKPTGIVH